MKRFVLSSIILLIVAGLALTADAETKKGGGGKPVASHDEEWSFEGFQANRLKALNLDEKQKEAIKAIHFRTKKDMIRKRADVQITRLELREIASNESVDIKAAEAAVRKIEAMNAEIKIALIKAREEIKSILTPEQKKKFMSMAGNGPMRHGKGMRNRRDMQCMDDMDDMGYGPYGKGAPQKSNP